MQLKFLAGRVSVPLKWIGTEKARELSNGELVLHNVVLDAEPDASAGAYPENEKEASCDTAALDGCPLMLCLCDVLVQALHCDVLGPTARRPRERR